MNKQEHIEQMESRIQELQEQLEEYKNAFDKVEFLKEGCSVLGDGSALTCRDPSYYEEIALRARFFATEEIARNVDDVVQQSYKIAQYVFQKAPDYVPNWKDGSEAKYFIAYNKKDEYTADYFCYTEQPGLVYMPKEVAEQLAEDLNNGNYSIR